jgi:hypothetical protein
VTVREAKTTADGRPVGLKGKVVTAIFSADGCIYIEDADRSSGIRVVNPGTGLAVGDRVDVTGTMGTRSLSGYSSERQISSATVTRVSSGIPLQPIGVVCRDLGGEAVPPLVPGVNGGVGLNNMGLLAQIAGKVTYIVSSYIYVDDGSNIQDISGRTGVMVKCPGTPTVAVGDMVAVTGIVEGSIPTGWTTNRRYIHSRDWNDIVYVGR